MLRGAWCRAQGAGRRAAGAGWPARPRPGGGPRVTLTCSATRAAAAAAGPPGSGRCAPGSAAPSRGWRRWRRFLERQGRLRTSIGCSLAEFHSVWSNSAGGAGRLRDHSLPSRLFSPPGLRVSGTEVSFRPRCALPLPTGRLAIAVPHGHGRPQPRIPCPGPRPGRGGGSSHSFGDARLAGVGESRGAGAESVLPARTW